MITFKIFLKLHETSLVKYIFDGTTIYRAKSQLVAPSTTNQ